jgi:probable rRNA maturation factor
MDSVPHKMDVQFATKHKGVPNERTFKKWLRAALPQSAELTLRVVNAAEARNLNSAFRGKDYATNVLTFVYHEKKSPILLGDIVLCAPIVAREAREQGKTLDAHYAHLTLHGALHLAGMDHETDRDARAMEKKEISILSTMGYANPYVELA